MSEKKKLKFPRRPFSGNYKIKALGNPPEYFLNFLFDSGLSRHCKNIRIKENALYFQCSLFTFPKIKRAASEAKIEIEVKEISGLPFYVYKFRRRIGLAVGFFAGCALLFLSTLFVWEVDVTGNKSIETDEVLAISESCGVHPGAFIPTLDVEKIQYEIIKNNRKISSVAVNLKGTYAKVDIMERAEPQPEIKPDGVFELAAAQSGIITRIEAKSGFPVVGVGDFVHEGDLLVSAFKKGDYDNIHCVSAQGSVYALTISEFELCVPCERTVEYFTGKEKIGREWVFLSKKITSNFLSDSPYERYKAVKSTYSPKILFGLKIPLQITEIKYRQTALTRRTISKEEAQKAAHMKMRRMLSQTDGALVSYDYKENLTELGCIIRVRATVERDIAKRREAILPE